MNYYSIVLGSALALGSFSACQQQAGSGQESSDTADSNFNVTAESFADLQLLRYQVTGWEELSLQQKKLAYYLSEAALSGRDIYSDQANKYGLTLRKTIEAIYGTYTGDKKSDN